MVRAGKFVLHDSNDSVNLLSDLISYCSLTLHYSGNLSI